MSVAVVLVPVSVLLKSWHEAFLFAGLITAMFSELIGLIFVILSIVKRKRTP